MSPFAKLSATLAAARHTIGGVSERAIHPLTAHKFGGSSLADAACFKRVAAILLERDDTSQVTVVSAMQGVTNGLIAIAKMAAASDPSWQAHWSALRKPHLNTSREANLDLCVRAIAPSQKSLVSERGDLPADVSAQLSSSELSADFERFTDHVHAAHLPHAVVIDCSASDEVASHYPDWLAAGVHVITPNKQAGSGGAGREVTAAGIFADLLRLGAALGARL